MAFLFYMPNMNMIELGSTLRPARQPRGLTQDKLARLAGVGCTKLSQFEDESIGEIGIHKVLRACAAHGLGLGRSLVE